VVISAAVRKMFCCAWNIIARQPPLQAILSQKIALYVENSPRCRGTGKFSGKYAPQPQQTELIWTMPWGCWVELEDKDVHCKEWECLIENFIEEEADTTVHRIYGQRATISVNYKPGDWDSVRAWILKAGSSWYEAETAEDPQNMNKFAAGSLGASQHTASSGYSRAGRRWSKCDIVSSVAS